VPADDAAEASLIEGLDVYPVPNLLALVDHLTGHAGLAPQQHEYSLGEPEDLPPYAADLAHIKGQEHVKRALEVAAAGSHNLIISYPPVASCPVFWVHYHLSRRSVFSCFIIISTSSKSPSQSLCLDRQLS
jgi:hypothetical protein